VSEPNRRWDGRRRHAVECEARGSRAPMRRCAGRGGPAPHARLRAYRPSPPRPHSSRRHEAGVQRRGTHFTWRLYEGLVEDARRARTRHVCVRRYGDELRLCARLLRARWHAVDTIGWTSITPPCTVPTLATYSTVTSRLSACPCQGDSVRCAPRPAPLAPVRPHAPCSCPHPSIGTSDANIIASTCPSAHRTHTAHEPRKSILHT